MSEYAPPPEGDPPMDDPTDLMALIRTGDWLDAQTFPPLRWAVHGLIPQGFGLFTGPPKAGKSWAALGIALAVASGGHAFGKVPVGDPRPVLYLALEDGDARLQWRARQLLGDGEAIPRLLHTVTRATPDVVVPLIRAWMGRHPNETPLVLLDTLGKVMPASRPGESAYQRDYRIGSVIKELADDRPGSTVMVIHHIRKATGEDWMDSTSGTNGLNGAADFTLNLSRTRNEDAGVLRVTGRDVSESEYAITSREGRWTLDGTSLADAAKVAQQARATEGLGDRSAEVIRILDRNPQGLGPTEVARELGDMTASNAGTYLDRLVKSGRIAKKGRGLYAPVESVESVKTGEPDGDGFHTFHGFHTTTETDAQPSPFPLITGPGRCTTCGFHVPTQGHRAACMAAA